MESGVENKKLERRELRNKRGGKYWWEERCGLSFIVARPQRSPIIVNISKSRYRASGFKKPLFQSGIVRRGRWRLKSRYFRAKSWGEEGWGTIGNSEYNNTDKAEKSWLIKWMPLNFFRKLCEENYCLLNDVTRWRSCSGMMRGCVPRIRIWPPGCDKRSGALIGTGETPRPDWPRRV